MANPVLPNITDGQATALNTGAPHGGTGIIYIPEGIDSASSPKLITRLTQAFHHLSELLRGPNQGMVYQFANPADLRVGVFGLRYRIGATEYNYTGDASFTCTANVTNHLYVDNSGVLENNTSAWPGGDIIRLAKVVCGGSAITSIEDWRFANHLIGVVNNWWTSLPTAAVDLNTQDLSNVRQLKLANPTELTLASDTITPTASFHTVDTQADAGADDLVTITAPSGSGQVLLLRVENAARVVTVKSSGNIKLLTGDFVMDSTSKVIALVHYTGIGWLEVARNPASVSALVTDLDCNSKSITEVGKFNSSFTTAVLAGDAFAYSRRLTIVQSQSGTSDDLFNITGGADGDEVILFAASGHDILVTEIIGNIVLNFGTSYELDLGPLHLVNRAGAWVEVSRGWPSIGTLPDPNFSERYEIALFVSGALTINTTYKPSVFVPIGLRIIKTHARVVTNPSGGACIVDCLVGGASIFANEGEMANILNGTPSATSATKNHDVGVDSYVQVRTGSAVNGAADLSLTLVCARALGPVS